MKAKDVLDRESNHVMDGATEVGEWEGFGDEGSDKEDLDTRMKGDRAGKVKPARQKKKKDSNSKRKQDIAETAASNSGNPFAGLGDAADDGADGKRHLCVHTLSSQLTRTLSICLALS